MKKLRFTPLQIAVHIGAWIPLVWLVWAYTTHRLTVNPIQDAMQRTGKYALVLLVLCLACTPLNTLLGWQGVIKVRRALGLYAFLYAAIHFLILSGLDYQFNFVFLYADFRGKLYVWVGVAAWSDLAGPGSHFIPVDDETPGQELEAPAPADLSGRRAGRFALCLG